MQLGDRQPDLDSLNGLEDVMKYKTAWESLLLVANGHDTKRAKPPWPWKIQLIRGCSSELAPERWVI